MEAQYQLEKKKKKRFLELFALAILRITCQNIDRQLVRHGESKSNTVGKLRGRSVSQSYRGVGACCFL